MRDNSRNYAPTSIPEATPVELDAVVEHAASGISVADSGGYYIYANRSFCETTGYSLEELLGRHVLSIVHPDDRKKNAEVIRDLTAGGGEHLMIEKRIIRKDGELVWVQNALSAIFDAQGRVVSTVGVTHNLTELQNFKRALNDSERRYRALFHDSPSPIYVFDIATLEFLAVNQMALQYYGYTREEFLRMKLTDIRPAEEVPRLLEILRSRGFDPGQTGTWRHLRKDGTGFDADVVAHQISFDGREARMAIVKDVTDRRQVEIKLRESEARFRALTENSADRTVVLDAGGRATYVSPSSTRIFGYTPEEVTGLSAFGFMHPDDVNAGIDMFDKLLRQPGGTAQLRFRARHKDGRYVWVDCRGYNALDNAAVRGIVINERDITDEKELETQFLRAQRLESVGTLASGIAHDLNNILAPIIMSASMLRTRDLDGELKENLFSTIEVSAKRGADIVRQILTFTRGVEGERLLLQPLHILKEVVNIANETFPKNITVRARYSRGIWPVYGDPTQLHQVLMNLAVNARDAMPDGGTITLGAENVKVDAQYAATLKNGIEPGNYLAWSVTDTGAGIPAEIKDRIFDPFFTTKELGKGTGLGLSTVIGIVRGHNGGLTLESELGCGTKFTIFIPAIPGEALAEKESDRPELIQGNGELVLVVDDERGVLEMSRLVLERHGYRIAIARDGIEGLDFYARHVDEVAVVLTDIHMPKFDGLALVKAMRKLNPGVPIITSSGHTGVEVEEMLQKLEVNRFLKKPYTKGQLLGSISDVVEKANATRGATSARPAPIGAR